ncbi:hypothetical protein ABZ260_39650, partial [Streptosporangium sp. NPDC006013]|uniref:hypothetical protein n=1 Tax=Streptosporangium sp. NPDC006013 TaxID=3155596 RepID=UPI0033A2A4B2
EETPDEPFPGPPTGGGDDQRLAELLAFLRRRAGGSVTSPGGGCSVWCPAAWAPRSGSRTRSSPAADTGRDRRRDRIPARSQARK